MNRLEDFIAAITETRKVWLLQAMEGMFAMLEDDNGNSYIPVWESETLAKNSAIDDWEGYKVTEMGFSELVVWLKELSRDEIDIAVSPEKDGEITAIASANFGNGPSNMTTIHTLRKKTMMTMSQKQSQKAGQKAVSSMASIMAKAGRMSFNCRDVIYRVAE